MTGSVVVVADAGRDAGLGHIGRSSAVAVALRCREVETRCYAYGAEERFELDGIEWVPLSDDELPAPEGVLVIDSYRLAAAAVDRAAESNRLVFMHDYGSPPKGAALVVSAAAPPNGRAGWLCGLGYAALRPGYWGLPAREVSERLQRVLVTTGGGRYAETGRAVAQALAETLGPTTVTLVRGPHATIVAPPGVEVLDAPRSLLEPLLAADLVVSAAGQTMLEAAAAGAPCVALPLVENQRRQAAWLAELGAVRLVDPPEAADVTAACLELVQDAETRGGLSRNAQRAVDGYGALRVAFAIARLAASRP